MKIWPFSSLLFLLNILAAHSKERYPKTLPGKVLCGKNEIADWTVNNSTTVCRECPVCPTGYGSTFPCGDVKRYPHEKPIRCERCIKRKTFSSSRNADMCSLCATCIQHQTVLKKCNRRNNTICGKCEKGFYEYKDEFGIRTCEKCSRCCDDGNDNKIQECIDQGLQSSGQVCSVFDKERCKTKPTRNHQESPTNMTYHNDTTPTINQFKEPQLQPPLAPSKRDHPTNSQINSMEQKNININKNNINIQQGAPVDPNVVVAAVVPVVLLIILGVVIAVIAWYWWKNKKMIKKKKKTDGNGSDIEQGGNEETEPLSGNHGSGDNGSNTEDSSEASVCSPLVDLNHNESQPDTQPSSEIEMQTLPSTSRSDTAFGVEQESTKVIDYYEDQDRFNQAAFDDVRKEMDNDKFKESLGLKTVLSSLGVQPSEVQYLRKDKEGVYEALLHAIKANDPDKTLEDISQALEKPGAGPRNDLAQKVREEDKRMLDKKARAA